MPSYKRRTPASPLRLRTSQQASIKQFTTSKKTNMRPSPRGNKQDNRFPPLIEEVHQEDLSDSSGSTKRIDNMAMASKGDSVTNDNDESFKAKQVQDR
jgi:hypothetical protein